MLFSAALAQAEPTSVVIPGKSWSLTYDIGLVTQYQGEKSGEKFQYIAGTGSVFDAPRTVISFFLEKEAAESKEACHKEFWSKSKSNPLIDKSSVKHESFHNYEQVIYKYVNGMQHANYYFVNDGYCADVHISLSKPMPLSEEVMGGYGKTLKW